MTDIVLEHWKLSKLCYVIEKKLGLLGLIVIVKGIISSFLVFLVALNVCLASNMLTSVSTLRHFCTSNVFFNSVKGFFLLSHSQQWYILFLKERVVYLLDNAVGGFI